MIRFSNRGRNIAIMTSQDQGAEIEFAPQSQKDGSSQYSKKPGRKIIKQRSICSPRRLMNSPPPKQTPPFPSEDLPPLPPSPCRRLSTPLSTPLYFIKTPPPPAPAQRPLTPGMARPVLMKMATITSPSVSRSDSSFCLNFIKHKTLSPFKVFQTFCLNLISSSSDKQIEVLSFRKVKTFAIMFVYFVLERTREKKTP